MKDQKVDVYISGTTKLFIQRCAKELHTSESSMVNIIIEEFKKSKEDKYGKGKEAKFFSAAFHE